MLNTRALHIGLLKSKTTIVSTAEELRTSGSARAS